MLLTEKQLGKVSRPLTEATTSALEAAEQKWGGESLYADTAALKDIEQALGGFKLASHYTGVSYNSRYRIIDFIVDDAFYGPYVRMIDLKTGKVEVGGGANFSKRADIKTAIKAGQDMAKNTLEFLKKLGI